jgi:hypothetical protein
MVRTEHWKLEWTYYLELSAKASASSRIVLVEPRMSKQTGRSVLILILTLLERFMTCTGFRLRTSVGYAREKSRLV